MDNLMTAFKVTLLVWSFIFQSIQPSSIKSAFSDISVVSDIVNYVKPYLKALRVEPQTFHQRSIPTTSPYEAIEKKVKELKPYLQDDDIGEKIELEGDEETTIIEFTPRFERHNITNRNNDTDSFENNLRKYKKMRNHIKYSLESESVSDKTKHFITRTLDEMIAMLVQRQCPQTLIQNNDLKKMVDFRRNILNPYQYCNKFGIKISEEECKKLVETAKDGYDNCIVNNERISPELCKKIVENVTQTINPMSFGSIKDVLGKIFPIKHISNTQISNFYHSFTNTLSNILRDSDKIPDNYKVRCSLVDVDKENMRKAVRHRDACREFRVCSEEFKEFLTIFYKSLNDTAVRAFRNYAAMYEKDIIADDSEEKHTVISAIKHVSDIVEDRVSTVFVKTTVQIKLDENKDRDMNIVALREYVKYTVRSVNKTVNKHIENDLRSLKARMLLAIKNDITHNLGSDLKNFESDVIKQICSFFLTCKGTMFKSSTDYSRRQFTATGKKSKSVFVKLELALDDELRDKLVNNHRAKIQNLRAQDHSEANRTTVRRSNFDTNHKVIVTRTSSYANNEFLPTTKRMRFLSEENNDSNDIL